MEEITTPQSLQRLDSTPSDAERWASVIGGSAMVLIGLRQGSLRGVLTALAGGSLAYHGVQGQKSLPDVVSEAIGINQMLRVEKTVTINKTADELYHYWRNFEQLPTFMRHIQSITVIDPRRSHWVTKAPLGQSIEWDANILDDRPNELISWASVEGADVEHSGFVRFKPAPGNRGTEVKVVTEYNPPGGTFGVAFAKLFGEAPEQQIGDELSRFKQLMETGEIATTEGQPSGRH